MSFLNRRRSPQALHVKDESKPVPNLPSLLPPYAAIENVPQKGRYRTTTNIGASRIINQVSSIFTPRKKTPPPNLKLVNSGLNNPYTNSSSPPRPWFYSVSEDSFDSVDDIRRPSDLGSSVSIFSNRSLPPSPRSSHAPHPESPFANHTIFPSGEFQRTRATSSPNLLRTLSRQINPKNSTKRSLTVPTLVIQPLFSLQIKPAVQLPEEIIVLILRNLPLSNIGSSATVSRTFASAAHIALYTSLDLDSLSSLQLEKLVGLLVSRRELTDLVITLICRNWPTFFSSGTNDRLSIQHDQITHKNALLTASFTLALDRMSNLHSLTLPSFDVNLLAQHSAFGLKSLTFLNRAVTDAETRALFTWLDGQINITSVRFTNMEDFHTGKLSDIAHHDNTRPETAPSSPFLKPCGLSPYASPLSTPPSAIFHRPLSPPNSISLSSSSTLLPNLTTLHATPALLMLLTPPLVTASRRPLTRVTLNINTTLYDGLRPASLMSSLQGVMHLALRFSENVDKRSFEKVIGAAGASLGAYSKFDVDASFLDVHTPQESDRSGLRSFEIFFHTPACNQSGRDEAMYKSLQASLPRYKVLSSLRLSILSPDDPYSEAGREPSPSEQTLLDSWVKLCPTLQSITLFSGARWQQSPVIMQQLQQNTS